MPYRSLIIGILMVMVITTGCSLKKQPVVANQNNVREIKNTVYFDFDKHAVVNDSKIVLNEIIENTQNRPDIRLILEGHTDSTGADDYNIILGEKRARAVGAYLAQQGLDYRQMTFISKGKQEPKYYYKTKNANKLNRRTEIYQQ